MAQDVLAYTTLQVIPTMRGAAAAIGNELSGLGAVGRNAGRDIGKGVAKGISDSKADVERASAVVAAARDKEADAAGKVRVAEARLEELRESGKAKVSQLARAEEQLATALRGREQASRTTAKAAEALEQANKRAADSVSNVDVGGGLMSKLNGRLSGIGEKLTGALQGVSRKAGESSGSEIAGGLGDKFGEMLGGKGGLIGGTVAAAVSLAGLSAPGLLFAAMNRGMANQQALDLTQARLGVDDLTMQKIGASAGRAYTHSFGSSVAENAETARMAIQSGLLDESATGQETQKVIEQLSGVSSLLGEEIPAVARAAGQAVKTGIAGDATEAFDLFTAAQQNGLNVSEDFLDTITEYGTQFRKLGLSGPEAIGLVNQAVQAGARDTDVAADAIKEFSIRVVDGSDATKEAFQSLGFDADALAHRFAEGGTVARTATGDLLAKIREIKDPLEQNKVALALFGTQFEDLGAALGEFNLDSAAASLGKVGGAAQDALNKMGGNAAASIEGAKRSIEVSADQISNALAKAFGPELAKLADWVTQHQAEIIGFLGKVVDGAFGAADALLGFSSSGLRALAAFAEGAGTALAGVTRPFGAVTEAFGRLTGNATLTNLGNDLRNLDSSFDSAAATARGMADSIDNTARPALDRMRTSVGDNIATAQNSQLVYQALGNTVATLPDGHTITLQDNTPETTARLEALGLKVTTLPNGQVTVTANTAEGQKVLDDFVTTNTGRKIPMQANILMQAIAGDQAAVQQVQVGGVQQLFPSAKADGGISHAAQITNRPILWGEAGPEAYIPLDPAKRDRSVPIWLEVGRRLGMMTAVAMAAGGIVPGKNAAMQLDPAVYQMGGFSTRAIDCSGLVSAVVNDATGRPMFSDRMSTMNEGEWLKARGALPGLGGPGDISIAWFDRGGGANGHTAMRLGDGTKVESRSGDGVVVGSAATDVTDPMFDQHMYIPRSALLGGDLGGSGGGALGAGGANALTSGGGVSGGGSGGGGASGAGGAGASAGRPQGDAVPVWVDNWPGSFTATPAATDSGDAAAASSSFSPGGGPPEAKQFDQQAAVNTALDNARTNFGKAGDTALRGQLEGVPGASALLGGVEKQVQNWNVVVSDVFELMNVHRREQQRQAMAAGARF
ncbi:phage tail tape measure protein [Nocardia wallacei]|uniref:phage tail tape measure protein n=1 Tax=Nocardia wallacei TaxID=480035 RepID=UPI0024587DA9|nr:phage tail tape measure protein [Nocardia wallacei]